ncbi:MAG: SDR family oxidoreductase [Prevotellaceae bacterium]|jgi:NAD(P)-dependent dehydrogenase (short-subunit alcohol dehydrogenase family)|nr:SDR family oxidoreductase [Prevotellaceae bacterium]
MNTVVLITGASSGIGKACAGYLAGKGFTVYGTSRKETVGIQQTPAFRMLKMDVTDSSSVKKAIDHIIAEQGRLDVVINNAGMGIGGALELATPEEIKLQMDTNFMGMANVCSAALPYLRQAGGGKIINLSSLGGVMGIPFQGFYSASKFAIEGYSETLSLEVHPFRIKVVLVEPGDFNTGFTSNRVVSEKTSNSEVYGAQFSKTMKVIEKEETGGGNPLKIARLMHRIIRSKHPKFRYKTGNFIQTNFAGAKKFIPARTYQYLLRFFYNIK